MENSFLGKNFVVAGGSKGIGLELVRQLVSAGGRVHVYSRTTGELTPNNQIVHHACNFLDDDFDATTLPEHIHGVAYCAGSINLRSFRGLKLEDFRTDFEINVMGAVKFLKACMPGLKSSSEDQATSVVLFSTVAVGKGLPMHASVAAAKGAIEGLTHSLAAEWAPAIRVNCIAPALTETPLAASFLATDEKRAAMAAKYPLKRTGRPADIASMAKFLLCPDHSWVTGQCIGVDGGMSTLGV
jgi:NAD(P)-dependent dehydrogenase (short-subunit alcohol dehydrogenase family)